VSWSTRPSEPAGHKVTAAEMKATLDQIDTLTAPGWTSYSGTFAWTSSTGTPALGNGTLNFAEYRRSADSDLISVRIKITFGTTSTFGTGVWFFSLPVTAGTNQAVMTAGWAYALDAGTQEYSGVCKIETAGTTFRVLPASNATDNVNNWSGASPFTFGSADVFSAQLMYFST
jgi:hypothetical protein